MGKTDNRAGSSSTNGLYSSRVKRDHNCEIGPTLNTGRAKDDWKLVQRKKATKNTVGTNNDNSLKSVSPVRKRHLHVTRLVVRTKASDPEHPYKKLGLKSLS